MGSGRDSARARGGRPSEWNHGPTRTIRIPSIFAETLLQIAKELDRGHEDVLTIDPKLLKLTRHQKKENLSLDQLRIYKHSGKKVIRLQDIVLILQEHLKED